MPSGNSKMDDVQWADTNLVSPNNTVFITHVIGSVNVVASSAATAYVSGAGSALSTLTVESAGPGLETYYHIPSQLAVAGKNRKFELLAQLFTGATKANQTVSLNIHKLKAITAGSYEVAAALKTLAIGNANANTITPAASGLFLIEEEGPYVFSYSVSGATQAGTQAKIAFSLRSQAV